jgi:hypothetical protein
VRVLLPKECHEYCVNGKGGTLIQIAHSYNALVQAKFEITVNQFRAIYGLQPFEDERGDLSILATETLKESDRVSASK